MKRIIAIVFLGGCIGTRDMPAGLRQILKAEGLKYTLHSNPLSTPDLSGIQSSLLRRSKMFIAIGQFVIPLRRSGMSLNTSQHIALRWSAERKKPGYKRQLTNFAAPGISKYAFSRDGKQLAVTRTTFTSDIILISYGQ